MNMLLAGITISAIIIVAGMLGAALYLQHLRNKKKLKII